MDTNGTHPTPTMETPATVSVAASFVQALSARDFETLERLFDARVRFRAIVPRGLREAATAEDAVGWLRTWFAGADSMELLGSDTATVADRTYLRYRFRVHQAGRVTLIEQHGYADVADGRIADLSLLCSGFRPEDQVADRVHHYDAGDLGCGDGLPREFRGQILSIPVGDVLRVVTRDPAARADLPSLARLMGHRVGTISEAPDGGLVIDVERVQ